jgi:chaperonin cofactor prefoldin
MTVPGVLRMKNMNIKMKIDNLTSLSEQKYLILKKIYSLLQEQTDLILTHRYKGLDECLDRTEAVVDSLKKINSRLQEQYAEIKPFITKKINSTALLKYNILKERIDELTRTLFKMSANCQKIAESDFNKVKNNIKDININRKGFKSYQKAGIIDGSLYFDQNR